MKSNATKIIFDYFDELFPNVKGELLYKHDYELLIAVVLSAQSTDKQVNIVTTKLFSNYPTIFSLNELTKEEFEQHFNSLGLYKTKAKNVFELLKIICTKYDGKVPSAKNDLLLLPGVGPKTANVVRGELFNIPEIAVDTHVARIAKRLGFAQFTDNVSVIEKKLRLSMPKERYIKTHHQMIHFGRYFCKAKRPECKKCKLVEICLEPNKNL